MTGEGRRAAAWVEEWAVWAFDQGVLRNNTKVGGARGRLKRRRLAGALTPGIVAENRVQMLCTACRVKYGDHKEGSMEFAFDNRAT